MTRARTLKVILVLVGVLFLASAYPLVTFIREAPAPSMMFSLYVTLGAFLLLAVRNPVEHRSLIAFTAWSSFIHAALMNLQSYLRMIMQEELVAVALLLVIGVALVILAPSKQVGQ
ncbi:MAG: DUF6632 domain-containing protein [Acidobacteriota bacterium]